MKQPRYFEVKIISRLLRNPALHSVGFNDFYLNYLPNWVELEFVTLIFFGLSSFIHQNIHLSAESVYFVNLGLSFCKLRNKSSEYPIFIKLNFKYVTLADIISIIFDRLSTGTKAECWSVKKKQCQIKFPTKINLALLFEIWIGCLRVLNTLQLECVQTLLGIILLSKLKIIE